MFKAVRATHREFGFNNLIYLSPVHFNPRFKERVIAEIKNNSDVFYFSVAEDQKLSHDEVGTTGPQREFMGIKENDKLSVSLSEEENKCSLTSIEVQISKNLSEIDKSWIFSHNELENVFKQRLNGQMINCNQYIPVKFNPKKNVSVIFKCDIQQVFGVLKTSYGYITENTHINFTSSLETLEITDVQQNVFKSQINLQQLGIGGLNEEFQVILRRAFGTRMVDHRTAESMGLSHVKGILLYGEPGCGKTVTARQIGKILNCEEPKVVNGPSLLSKFVGESERQIRELFPDPKKNDPNKLHLIILDEIDALVKSRSSSSSDVHGDKIVNQFLTMIDGIEQFNNVLLIGMTNRKDLIDPALLRPGRFEIQIHIGLPDEQGRLEILQIHTQKMIAGDFVDKNVNLQEIARNTRNFTGAEIAGLVRSAQSFAIAREADLTDGKINNSNIKPQVTEKDFQQAFAEINPMFGSSSSEIFSYTTNKFVFWCEQLKTFHHQTLNDIECLKDNQIHTLLINGPTLCGKTKLVSHIAVESGVTCVRRISPECFAGSASEQNKCQFIYNHFTEALKTKQSIVILDNLERLIDWVPLGPRFSNAVLQTILSVVRKDIFEDTKCTLILISSSAEMIELLKIHELVDLYFNFPYTIEETKVRETVEKEFQLKLNKTQKSIMDVFKLHKFNRS